MILNGIRVRRDMTGEVFGTLTVMSFAGRNSAGRTAWICRCSCGAETVARTNDLTSGNTTSCGCRRVAAGQEIGRLGVLDEPSYKAAHRRVYRERGRAVYQACVDCGAPAEDWSYDGTDPAELEAPQRGGETPMRYSGKPEHYSPRCKPCHRAFDRA